jgi:hypothetical protein
VFSPSCLAPPTDAISHLAPLGWTRGVSDIPARARVAPLTRCLRRWPTLITSTIILGDPRRRPRADPMDMYLLPRRAVAAGSVLLVDDDPVNRRMVARMLESLGHPVIEASDAEEALRQLPASPPRWRGSRRHSSCSTALPERACNQVTVRARKRSGWPSGAPRRRCRPSTRPRPDGRPASQAPRRAARRPAGVGRHAGPGPRMLNNLAESAGAAILDELRGAKMKGPETSGTTSSCSSVRTTGEPLRCTLPVNRRRPAR